MASLKSRSVAQVSSSITESELSMSAHIIPDVLYPAVNGMIDYDSQYTFTDSSGTPKTITSVGQAHHIGNPKIGSTSIRLDSNDYLTVPGHADFNFGTSDFCVEWWWKGDFAANGCWWSLGHTGEAWICYQEANNKIRVTMGSAGTRQWDFPSANVWQGDDAWHHFAMTKTGTGASAMSFYIDGVEEDTINGSFTATPASSINLSSQILAIGAMSNGAQPLNVNSNIDEFRISNHIRYSSNFTPSTTAFSNDSNTKFLLHSEAGGNVGAYGTAQSDSKKYYYTDIKGSKPIKDPRIGAHFGTHRHKTRSLQMLEQETATNGTDVYSVDGREWMRCNGPSSRGNNAHGEFITVNAGQSGTGSIEIVGYFSGFNMCALATSGEQNQYVYKIDGGGFTAEQSEFTTGSGELKGGRYKSRGTLMNLFNNQTLGIHTITLRASTASDYIALYDIELTAQDTTSGTTRSQIQIPAQNVISYGKNHTVAAETKHYNPFAFKTDGSTAWASGAHNGTAWPVGTGSSANIDVATSLGLGAWVSTNYYKPYNGGRVVKWVDSDGTIKTSVNVMPPNAQNTGSTSISAKANATIANNTYLPTYSGIIDHSQSEIAKTFNFREFGNGNTNAGTGGSYKDYSQMANESGTDVSFTLDDGLTGLNGSAYITAYNSLDWDAGDYFYFTFIGTGLSYWGQNPKNMDLAQNLPYGTHIFTVSMTGGSPWTGTYLLDGVTMPMTSATYFSLRDLTIHQPKMPPIPEDAVVIADYMLMADYVGQTADGLTGLSKGCRRQGISSDLMMARTDGVSSFSFSHTPASPSGWQINMNSASSSTSVQYRLTAFCTNFVERGVLLTSRSRLTVDDAIQADGGSTTIGTNSSDQSGYYRLVSDLALGEYKIGVNNVSGQAGNHICYDIATPIHTSSHYQEFESPTLKELIGGDRNMEQTNLVVTAEGKTWDEITRDTSYIGKGRVSCHFVGSSPSVDALVYMDDWRGLTTGTEYYNKDFAISYDRIICLVPGNYTIVAQSMMSVPNTGSNHVGIFINGAQRMQGHTGTHSYSTTTPMAVVDLNWGDYVQVKGRYRAEQSRAGFYIERN